MSVLTGKCDFYDSCKMIGNIEEYLGDNAEIYVGDIRIPNETEKDIALYYPFLTSVGFHSNNHNVVYLSKYSYIDYEEYERLTLALNYFKRYYRKCKRNKIKYEAEEALKINGYDKFGSKDTYFTLSKRVEEQGEKANIFGLSLDFYDNYYRKTFYDFLIEIGYNEQFASYWVYKRKEKLFYERNWELK